MKNKILRCIAVVCALACAISIAQIIRIEHQYKVGEKAYDDLALNLVTLSAADDFTAPGDEIGAPIDVNFELLSQMNAEAVGWLYSPGTPINYPVVRSDDNSYYLKHLYNDQKNSSGAIFMDALNDPDMTHINTVIYGHNMKNGSMFASLQNYSDPAYLREHPTIYYMNAQHDYRIDVFACYPESAAAETYTINFDSAETYAGYLQRVWGKSEISADVPMTTDDNIVTLVTCTGYSNDRYVVLGKITQIS